MTPLEWVILIVGAVLSYCAWTYAFVQDNKAYALAENIYLGGSSIYAIITIIKSISSSGLDPLSAGHISFIIPIVIGLLAFTRLTRFRWAARYSTAVMSGVGVGVIFGLNIRTQILAAVTSTANDLLGAQTGVGPGWPETPDLLSAILMVASVIGVSVFFMYSAKWTQQTHQRGGTLYYLMRFGRIMFLISIGYMSRATLFANSLNAMIQFGNTAIARVLKTILAGG
jgi:phosphoglycerol transferase MdoB-like AlkP superfamily enzyme